MMLLTVHHYLIYWEWNKYCTSRNTAIHWAYLFLLEWFEKVYMTYDYIAQIISHIIPHIIPHAIGNKRCHTRGNTATIGYISSQCRVNTAHVPPSSAPPMGGIDTRKAYQTRPHSVVADQSDKRTRETGPTRIANQNATIPRRGRHTPLWLPVSSFSSSVLPTPLFSLSHHRAMMRP